jgi:tRNA pseudouridine(54/55) synthase
MTALPKGRVFLEGRYRKLSRDLPQTVFFCPDCKGHPRRRKDCARCEGFGKLTRDSVQELVSWVAGAAFRTRKNKFHGAGREDVDVRMLGEGRPFVLELVDPKVLEVDLAALEAEINRRNPGRLEVRGLHWSDRSRVRELKESEHAKEYEALLELGGELDPARAEALVGRRLGIQQKTPQRVAHRRADKVRERWIEVRSIEPAESRHRRGRRHRALALGSPGRPLPLPGPGRARPARRAGRAAARAPATAQLRRRALSKAPLPIPPALVLRRGFGFPACARRGPARAPRP